MNKHLNLLREKPDGSPREGCSRTNCQRPSRKGQAGASGQQGRVCCGLSGVSEMESNGRGTLAFHCHHILPRYPNHGITVPWIVPSSIVVLNHFGHPPPSWHFRDPPFSYYGLLTDHSPSCSPPPHLAQASVSPVSQGIRVLCPCQSVGPILLCNSSVSGTCTEPSLKTSANGSA